MAVLSFSPRSHKLSALHRRKEKDDVGNIAICNSSTIWIIIKENAERSGFSVPKCFTAECHFM
jgi:hypothetical protein